MKVTPEKLENNRARLTIEVPADQFEKSLDKAFKEVVKKINVPGFRKGKAPRHMVERMYGREVFLEDAIKEAIPEAFADAVEQAGEGYECLVYPSYDVISSEKGQGLVFTAEYDLKPEVKLGEYKNLDVVKPIQPPVEDAVAIQLKVMQDRFARLDEVEGPAKMGDVCVINFVGKVDDVPFEGGTGNDYSLELGSNSFIPGFEDQLVGAKAYDEVAVKVTFPEDYRAKELAGKAAVFDVLVKAVKRKFVSALDDEFAKDVSEFETLEALKADLAEKAAKQNEEKLKSNLEDQVIQQAIDNSQLEIPQSMLDIRMDQMIENFAKQIAQQGISFQQYMDITGMNPETVREQFKERAQKELTTELVLDAVVKAEGIQVSEEELDAEFERLAKQVNQPAETIKDTYGKNEEWVKSLKYSLSVQKAVKLMTDSAKF